MVLLKGLLNHTCVVGCPNLIDVPNNSELKRKAYEENEVVSEDLFAATFAGLGLLGNATHTARPFRSRTWLQDTTRASLNYWADLFILACAISCYFFKLYSIFCMRSSGVRLVTKASGLDSSS